MLTPSTKQVQVAWSWRRLGPLYTLLLFCVLFSSAVVFFFFFSILSICNMHAHINTQTDTETQASINPGCLCDCCDNKPRGAYWKQTLKPEQVIHNDPPWFCSTTANVVISFLSRWRTDGFTDLKPEHYDQDVFSSAQHKNWKVPARSN